MILLSPFLRIPEVGLGAARASSFGVPSLHPASLKGAEKGRRNHLRSVFLGIGGFLGRIDGETRVAFWVEEPVDHDFDPKRLITIDLALAPSAAAARDISWDAVQVDDCLRLLGCETAVSPGGQRTLRLLARTLRVPVLGSTRPLLKSHYDERGFNPAFAHVLVEASDPARDVPPVVVP